MAIGRVVKQVLAVTYDEPLGMNPHATTLLQLLKMDDSIQNILPMSTVLSTNEYILG